MRHGSRDSKPLIPNGSESDSLFINLLDLFWYYFLYFPNGYDVDFEAQLEQFKDPNLKPKSWQVEGPN